MKTMTKTQRQAHDVLHDIPKEKGLTIRTNNVPRFTIDAFELTSTEREEFDYLNWDAINKGEDSATFFQYKGQLHDLSQFMKCGHAFGLEGWEGYFSDSMFSGVLFKWAGADFDEVIVGMYFS